MRAFNVYYRDQIIKVKADGWEILSKNNVYFYIEHGDCKRNIAAFPMFQIGGFKEILDDVPEDEVAQLPFN